MIHSELKNEYLEALSYWQLQLQDLHELLLDGKTMSPDKIKGLLGREARAKEKYDMLRLKILGIES